MGVQFPAFQSIIVPLKMGTTVKICGRVTDTVMHSVKLSESVPVADMVF
jgi:hypothetical protein